MRARRPPKIVVMVMMSFRQVEYREEKNWGRACQLKFVKGNRVPRQGVDTIWAAKE